MKMSFKLNNVNIENVSLGDINVFVEYTPKEVMEEWEAIKKIVKESPDVINDLKSALISGIKACRDSKDEIEPLIAEMVNGSFSAQQNDNIEKTNDEYNRVLSQLTDEEE